MNMMLSSYPPMMLSVVDGSRAPRVDSSRQLGNHPAKSDRFKGVDCFVRKEHQLLCVATDEKEANSVFQFAVDLVGQQPSAVQSCSMVSGIGPCGQPSCWQRCNRTHEMCNLLCRYNAASHDGSVCDSRFNGPSGLSLLHRSASEGMPVFLAERYGNAVRRIDLDSGASSGAVRTLWRGEALYRPLDVKQSMGFFVWNPRANVAK